MGVVAFEQEYLYNKYYLYRHIRLDKNEPFYIGVGTKMFSATNYGRANSRTKRNSIWHAIANKTEYRVDIMFESEDSKEVLEKEKEFISLYGRIKFEGGLLANLSMGGEGHEKKLYNGESNKLKNKGRIPGSKTRERMSDSQSKGIFQYATDGKFIKKWKNGELAEKSLGLSSGMTSAALTRNKTNVAGGYFWFRVYQGDVLKQIPKFRQGPKPVYVYDLNDNLLYEFKSERQTVIQMFDSHKLSACIRYSMAKEHRTYRGYKFRNKKI